MTDVRHCALESDDRSKPAVSVTPDWNSVPWSVTSHRPMPLRLVPP